MLYSEYYLYLAPIAKYIVTMRFNNMSGMHLQARGICMYNLSQQYPCLHEFSGLAYICALTGFTADLHGYFCVHYRYMRSTFIVQYACVYNLSIIRQPLAFSHSCCSYPWRMNAYAPCYIATEYHQMTMFTQIYACSCGASRGVGSLANNNSGMRISPLAI